MDEYTKYNERYKRFKRNLRLAKRKIHFRVWKRNCISSMCAEGKNITFFCRKKFFGFLYKNNHLKRNVKKFSIASDDAKLLIKKPLCWKLGYIYIRFYEVVPERICVISEGGKKRNIKCDWLHQVIDLSEFVNEKEIVVKFEKGVKISQIQIFSKGNLPEWVQRWDKPYEKADLLAMSTHSDDEHLFFAGVLPLYIAKKKKIQMSYFVPPREKYRYNELLDGLWQIGVRAYPVFADFIDEYSESIEETLYNLKKQGKTENDARKYIVSIIRRFQPNVIIGQDPINGEYGHGQHAFFAKMLLSAVELTNRKEFDSDSAEQWGTYVVPKLYLHLYERKPIVLNLDKNMKELYNLTPFQISQEGFSFHRSQYVAFFPKHLYGTIRHPMKRASQIEGYSPCKWGLAFTTVGDDVTCDDMFENI